MDPARVTAVLLAVALALGAATPAGAHDSMAPPDAPHSWLPEEPWVMQHWLPYEEPALYAALGIDRAALLRWLIDDHRTLAELARRRGRNPRVVLNRLVGPWAPLVEPAHFDELRQRALRTFSQGHLAQHVFFHPFHGLDGGHPGPEGAQVIFGVPRHEFQQLRQEGLTPVQIGARGGFAAGDVHSAMLGVLQAGALQGFEQGQQSPTQAALLVRQQAALLPCWLYRPLPKFDLGNPLGDPNGGHGRHERRTRNGLQPESKARRVLRRGGSCWVDGLGRQARRGPSRRR